MMFIPADTELKPTYGKEPLAYLRYCLFTNYLKVKYPTGDWSYREQ